MTGPVPPPARGVVLLEARRIRMVEVDTPALPPGLRSAMDRAWDAAVAAAPALFDGPVAACVGLDREGPDSLVLSWARTTYRRHVLRRFPGAAGWLPSLFVAVMQPDEDGRLLIGRMAPWTAALRRRQLPGGSAEPPAADETLDLAALRRHAARELAEETGTVVPPGDLALWAVTRAANGTVGVLFLAPPRPEALLRERFAALVASETALGLEPEFDGIGFVGSPGDVVALGDRAVDYLAPVVRRWADREGEPAGRLRSQDPPA
ncbi:NUDIX hydrolase [Streptomyces sp. NPDC088354]|uniref:NUDIX hydrolase n=1 Tax=Streptomyces sp. NPDC088354 TaxID=3365856 RepID=UPI003818862F